MSFSSSTCTLSVQRIIQWLIVANESSASRHIDPSIWKTHTRIWNGVQSEAARPGEILITTRVRRTPGSARFKQPRTPFTMYEWIVCCIPTSNLILRGVMSSFGSLMVTWEDSPTSMVS
jgi:hypothetical protein